MSFSFQLRYFLGLIPKVQKIDSAWAELFRMRNELLQIEASVELARYHELKEKILSDDFITKKREINNLNLKNSDEFHLLNELATLEKLNPIKRYFKFIQSPDCDRVNRITGSKELERYHELVNIVQSADFIQFQKETKALRYKGSPEQVKRREYNALEKSSRLKRYRSTLESEEYHLFLKLNEDEKNKLNSLEEEDKKVRIYRHFLKSKAYQNMLEVEKHDLTGRLEHLKQEVNSQHFLDHEAFLLDKNRYTTTPDYQIYKEFTELSRDENIRFYNKCLNSSAYANYKEIAGSAALDRLLELREKVVYPEFVQRVEFLRNKKRYELTPEYKLEVELKELENNKLILTYHKLKKSKELAFFEMWEITMDENFTDPNLTSSLWEPENYWGSKIAGFTFSQASELQAYQGLKNVEVRNQVLSLVTKSEKSKGKVWDPAIGIIPKDFAYTSAILNTGNSFKFKEGVVEAKVRFKAHEALTSAFSVTGNQPFPQIDIFRSGAGRVGLGIIDQSGNGGTSGLVQIKGLNFNDFHIFRLEVFEIGRAHV